jgi:hypothetical protein
VCKSRTSLSTCRCSAEMSLLYRCERYITDSVVMPRHERSLSYRCGRGHSRVWPLVPLRPRASRTSRASSALGRHRLQHMRMSTAGVLVYSTCASSTSGVLVYSTCVCLQQASSSTAPARPRLQHLRVLVYSTCACLQQESSSTAPVRRLRHLCVSTAGVLVYSTCACLQHAPSSTAPVRRLQHLCVSTAGALVYST